ncbi:hypothetical protein C8R44DRAFT_795854, partial [Mycena epipterygia]
ISINHSRKEDQHDAQFQIQPGKLMKILRPNNSFKKTIMTGRRHRVDLHTETICG